MTLVKSRQNKCENALRDQSVAETRLEFTDNVFIEDQFLNGNPFEYWSPIFGEEFGFAGKHIIIISIHIATRIRGRIMIRSRSEK